MSYVMSRISWRVMLLCWNHNPCLMNADWLQPTPATLLWHRQRNPSGRLESADHVTSRLQVLHCILLRNRPMSFRDSIAIVWWKNRHIKKKTVRTTSIPQYPTSVRKLPHLRHRPQEFFVLRKNFHQMFDHYITENVKRCLTFYLMLWSRSSCD